MDTVRRQVEQGDPAFVREAYDRIRSEIDDDDQALRLIAAAFLNETVRMLRAGKHEIDQASFAARLAALPEHEGSGAYPTTPPGEPA